MVDKNKYPLTVEILVDDPCGAGLSIGDICHARIVYDDWYSIYDAGDPESDWETSLCEAKIIKTEAV